MEMGNLPGSSSTLPPRPLTESNRGSSNDAERYGVDRHAGQRPPQAAGEAAYDPFLPRNEMLDACLERHHITGIAFSATIGIGILIFSGRILGLAGGLGAILSFLIAGWVVSSVMVCLAEMVSVRPVAGAMIDYPKRYVDPALGFAVGIIYWVAYTTSCVTLIVSGALICPSKTPPIIAAWLIIPLFCIGGINAFGGVRLYATIEWCFKWLKICFVVGLDITMIVLNRQGTPNSGGSIGFGKLANEFLPDGFYPQGHNNGSSSVDFGPEISGPTGIFLSVWTGITLAIYAFIGVEIVVVTAGEARYPKRDLPRASRRMYLWTLCFYVLSIFLVALNVDLFDPALLTLDDTQVASQYSPFVVALNNANLSQTSALTSAATVGLVLTAWATANTALYVASRTLHALFCESTTTVLRRTVGSTSSGGTPLWAIFVSLCPSLLAFVAVIPQDRQAVLDTFSNIAVTSILCVYMAECLAFIRFKSIATSDSLNRESPGYRRTYYRGPRQPFWAWFGLSSCSLLLIFNGWYTFYQIHQRTITASNATAGMIGAYGGPLLFLILIVWYKLRYRLPMVATSTFAQRFPTVQDDPPYKNLREPDNEALRWVVRALRFIM